MGYLTRYSLIVKVLVHGRALPLTNNFKLLNDLTTTYPEAGRALAMGAGYGEPTKWYQHEADLRSFSTKHPDILFSLRGEGETNGDVWIKYFVDGKCQTGRAEMRIGPFDPSKLV